MKRKLLTLLSLTMLLTSAVYGEVAVKLNGAAIDGANAVIEQDRTLVPLRGVFEAMGYEVSWDAETKTATLKNSENTITARPNESFFTLNGEQIDLDVPSRIIDERMYLHLRGISEASDYIVKWDPETKTVSINKKQEDEPIEISEGEISVEDAKALTNAQFIILNKTIEERKGENVLISPDSVASAFGMLSNGAEGQTLKEIEDVIAGGLNRNKLNDLLYSLNTRMSQSKDAHFHFANSLWARNDGRAEFAPRFVEVAQKYYSAGVFTEPFDASTVEKVNGWVSENTNGMIKKIIKEFNGNQVMCLINALSFEGEWAVEYSEDDIKEDGEFTNVKGEKEETPMLYSTENGCFKLNGGVGFKKSYKGGEFSYVAILPPENMGADEYALSIKGSDFIDALSKLDYDPDVYVKIPEYKYDFDTEMSDTLQALGMTSAFNGGDFTSLVTENSQSVEISSVIHKTHIEVDRKGTKAAAATAITMETSAIAPEYRNEVYIYLDRPFFYAIVDNKTNIPVFVGTVNSVK
ncbi:MAG: hypothetical protein IJS61_01640 [Firmicutes bacterium]|nr:hypothetical protein [Bacillota bacterium]